MNIWRLKLLEYTSRCVPVRDFYAFPVPCYASTSLQQNKFKRFDDWSI